MKRKDVLERALACVCGEREQDYGSTKNNFATIAALVVNWRAVIKWR